MKLFYDGIDDPRLATLDGYSEGGGYEIGHESQSGNSWGSFFQFERAEDAIKAAYNLARESYGNAIVWIDPVVLAAVPFTAGPARGSW